MLLSRGQVLTVPEMRGNLRKGIDLMRGCYDYKGGYYDHRRVPHFAGMVCCRIVAPIRHIDKDNLSYGEG